MPDFNCGLNTAFTTWLITRLALFITFVVKECWRFGKTRLGILYYSAVAATLLVRIWEATAGPSLALQMAQVIAVVIWLAFGVCLFWLIGRSLFRRGGDPME